MKNTLENKARFFALYPEADVIINNLNQGKLLGVCFCENPTFSVPCMHPEIDMQTYTFKHFNPTLELTPISLITDEDAKIVASIGYTIDNYKGNLQEFISNPATGKRWINVNNAGHSFTKLETSICIVDFIRSKRYAFSWNGLTVEQQVEYGWVKLKTI